MGDHAIARIQMSHAVAPDKPWVTYYAPGTAHAPHHAPKEWIAKFKGKFDMGWDKMREETLARQKAMGIVPANTSLRRGLKISRHGIPSTPTRRKSMPT
jgi:arylsulfatase A-like enzyme